MAWVSAVKGSPQYFPSEGGGPFFFSKGSPLASGDRIVTGHNEAVEIVFGNGSASILDKNTDLRITGLGKARGNALQIRVYLSSGRVFTRFIKNTQNDKIEYNTKTASAVLIDDSAHVVEVFPTREGKNVANFFLLSAANRRSAMLVKGAGKGSAVEKIIPGQGISVFEGTASATRFPITATTMDRLRHLEFSEQPPPRQAAKPAPSPAQPRAKKPAKAAPSKPSPKKIQPPSSRRASQSAKPARRASPVKKAPSKVKRDVTKDNEKDNEKDDAKDDSNLSTYLIAGGSALAVGAGIYIASEQLSKTDKSSPGNDPAPNGQDPQPQDPAPNPVPQKEGITGDWTGTLTTEYPLPCAASLGFITIDCSFVQSQESLSGNCSASGASGEVSGTVSQTIIRFAYPGQHSSMEFAGTVSDTSMTGAWGGKFACAGNPPEFAGGRFRMDKK